jgi:pimeloyl-ACP methyl ester carboxylesterase
MWDPVVEGLAGAYHCLVPDLPEHGRSVDVGPLALPDAAARVAALIRARAHGGRAHLVGISLGGQLSLVLLANRPELVGRAVVSGATVRPTPFVGLAVLLMRIYAPVRTVPWLVRANMHSLGIPERYFPQVLEDTRLLTAERFGRIIAANQGFRLPPGLAQAQVPVLVVVGQREPGVVRRSARDLLAALPCAAGRVVGGHGHAWSLEAPDLFARGVRAWLRAEPLPPALRPLA